MQDPSACYCTPRHRPTCAETPRRYQRSVPAPRTPWVLARAARNVDPRNRRLRSLVRQQRNRNPPLPPPQHYHPSPTLTIKHPKPPHNILTLALPPPTLATSHRGRQRRHVLQLPLLPRGYDQEPDANRRRGLEGQESEVLGGRAGDLEGKWG